MPPAEHRARNDSRRAARGSRGEDQGEDIARGAGRRRVLRGGPSERVDEARVRPKVVKEHLDDVIVAELRRPHQGRGPVHVPFVHERPTPRR